MGSQESALENLENPVELLLDPENVKKIEIAQISTSYPDMDKVNILLAMAGEKPPSLINWVISYKEDWTPIITQRKKREMEKDVEILTKLFDELKLPYAFH